MKIKRIISLVIVAIFVLTAIPSVTFADSKFTVEAENVTIEKGTTTVTVEINILNNPGIAVLGFEIGYEEEYMTLQSVTVGDEVFSASDVTAGNLSKNPYTYSAMNVEKNVQNDGLLLSLNFTIDDKCPIGTYTITLSNEEAYTLDEDEIEVCLENGSITLSSASQSVVANGSCGYDLTWTLYSDGTLTISGENSMVDFWGDDVTREIPWGDYLTDIKSVVIEEGVLSVGAGAFANCSSISNISIPESVTAIGDYAFYGCSKLENILISDNILRLGESAFAGTAYFKNEDNWDADGVLYLGKYLLDINSTFTEKTSYSVKSGTRIVAPFAFRDCKELVSVNLPKSLLTIESGAFNSCEKMHSISIPETVTLIGAGAFWNCINLETIQIPDSVKTIEEYAFTGCEKLTDISLPNGLTAIYRGTFDACQSLKEVQLPESITSIYDAFDSCTKLESIVIPKNVSFIRLGHLNYCDSLKYFVVDPANNCYTDIDGVLFSKDLSRIIRYPEGKTESAYRIPYTVSEVCTNCFDHAKIQEISIYKSIRTIDSGFSYLDNLADVYYEGSETDWNGIEFKNYNDSLLSSNIHFNSEIKKVSSINIEAAPTKTMYEHGDTLNTAGMVVTATYDDESTATVTDYTVTYSNGNYLKKGDTTVKVTFSGKEATITELAVGAKKITVTGLTATNRAYDGTTAVTLSGGSLVGVVSGETVTPVFPTSGTVADANAETGKAVTYAPIKLSGKDAENYTVDQPKISADISKADLTAKLFDITVPQDKTYDGNTIAITTPALKEDYASDGLQLSVFVNGVKEDNVPADAGTYTITFDSPDGGVNFNSTSEKMLVGTVTIAPRDVTITGLSAENKTYDGNTVVTVTGTAAIDGMIEGDDVTVSAGTAAFADAYAGTGKTVTFTGYALTGSKAGNYNLTAQPANTTADITAADQDPTITKTASLAKGGNTLDLSTFVTGAEGEVNFEIKSGSDYATLEGSTLRSSENLGDVVITVKIGAKNVDNNGANEYNAYNRDGAITVHIVNKADAKVAIDGDTSITKTYGDPSFTLTASAENQGESNRIWNWTSNNTAVATVNNGVVTIVGHGSAAITAKFESNNTIGEASVSLTVNTKDVTITGLSAANKVYDGNTTAAITGTAVVDGKVGSDDVSVNIGTAAFADKNAANGKTVNFTGFSLTGDKAANYNLKTQPASVTANITPMAVTITNVTAANKVYDGNATATITGTHTVDGKIGADDVTVTAGTASFDDANAKSEKTVTFTGFSLGGADKDNYVLSAQPASVKAKVTKADRDLAVEPETITLLPNSLTANANAKVENDIDKSAVVTATSSDTSVASVAVNGKVLTVKGLKNGSATITVDVVATGNYNAAVSKTIAVKVVVDPIEEISVTGTENDDTVSAILDCDTIKLTGLAANVENVNAGISVDDNLFTLDTETEGMIIVKDKEGNTVKTYSIDKSALAQKDAEIIVTASTDTENEIQSFSFNDNTKAEGVIEAAGAEIQKIASTKKVEGVTEVDVAINVEITGKSYENGIMTVDVTPTYTVTIKKTGEEPVIEEAVPLKSVSGEIVVSVNLPDGFIPTIAKLIHGEKDVEYVAVSVSGGVATWKMSRFSDVELIAGKTFTVNYNKNDGSIESVAYDMTAIGKALNVDVKSGNTFDGWSFEEIEGTYKTMTEELFNKLSEKTEDITATPNFRINYTGGGGGVVSNVGKVAVSETENGKVTVSTTSAKAGDKVTITATPDDGYVLKSLEVKDKNGNTVAVANGEFTMPDGDVVVTAVFVKAQKFVDVPADSYYADAVDWAVANSITNGVDETHFAPDASCTRAQAVTFLWRALGCPEPTATKSEFTDVTDANAFYYKAVLWATENGVTNGIGDGSFGVNGIVNRAQMVTFMERAMKGKAKTAESFTDVPEGAFYADAAAWAKENGVSEGIGDNKFGGEIDCLRAQIVTMLYRYFVK